MLARAGHVVFAATTGLFAVMFVERVWIITFLPRSDAPLFFDEPGPWLLMDGLASGYIQSLIGVALMIWLVSRMLRHALRR